MPDLSNRYIVARILNYPSPEPERVQFARAVRVDRDWTDVEWGGVEDAEELRPDVAAALLQDCEERENRDERSPGCVDPDEFHLLVPEDVRRLAARQDLSPELLRDETRRLAFPRDERGPELLEAAHCMLSGRLSTGDHRPLDDAEWQELFEEDDVVPPRDDEVRVWVESDEAMVALCPDGSCIVWNPAAINPRFYPSPYATVRKLAPLLRAAERRTQG